MAAGIVVAVVGVAGCAPGKELTPRHTAQVTINGEDAGAHQITCSQIPQWYWKINTLDDAPGFDATVRTAGDHVTAESVQIQDLGGFTGTYWPNGVGDAEASIENQTFTITGTAVGFTSQKPHETSSASFSITTNC